MDSTPRKRAAGPKVDGGSSRDKVRSHRARLREQGLRPLQIWVPDTRQLKFSAEAARQSRRVARSTRAAEDQAFVEAVSEIDLG